MTSRRITKTIIIRRRSTRSLTNRATFSIQAPSHMSYGTCINHPCCPFPFSATTCILALSLRSIIHDANRRPITTKVYPSSLLNLYFCPQLCFSTVLVFILFQHPISVTLLGSTISHDLSCQLRRHCSADNDNHENVLYVYVMPPPQPPALASVTRA